MSSSPRQRSGPRNDAVAGLILANGVPAVAGIMPIRPLEPDPLATYPQHLIVLIDIVDDRMLAEFADVYLLPGLRIAMGRDSDPRTVPLVLGDGRAVGELAWISADPGTDLLRFSVPVWIGVSIGFAGLTALLIRKAMGAAAKFDQSEHQARHDLLTGLPNRFGLFQAIETLAPSSGPLRGFAVAYMDLDGFKPINDAFGHAAGDVVLRTVAGRLRQSIPREGLVARIGGDEFVALLIDVTTMREASTICETILDRVGQPIEIDGSFVSVGITVGVAFCPGNGSDALALMRRADEALYAGKRLAKGSVQFHAGLTLATAAG